MEGAGSGGVIKVLLWAAVHMEMSSQLPGVQREVRLVDTLESH